MEPARKAAAPFCCAAGSGPAGFKERYRHAIQYSRLHGALAHGRTGHLRMTLDGKGNANELPA
jgi:hypothetical protein